MQIHRASIGTLAQHLSRALYQAFIVPDPGLPRPISWKLNPVRQTRFANHAAPVETGGSGGRRVAREVNPRNQRGSSRNFGLKAIKCKKLISRPVRLAPGPPRFYIPATSRPAPPRTRS